MSTNIPAKIPDLINWANAHTPLWQTNQAAIGLSAAQISQFKNLVDAMNAANTAAEVARTASKDATLNLSVAVTGVRSIGGAFVNVIKAYASSTHNMAVYSLAGVSPDSPAGTVPAPVPPTSFTATVNGNGSLTIKWKVSQPDGVTGVQYNVLRRIGGSEQPFVNVANVGGKKLYTDNTLPIGIDRVDYIVQPTRTNSVGDQSNIFAVQFGTVGGGGAAGFSIASMSTSEHASPMRVAA